jgi:hypothetical protein
LLIFSAGNSRLTRSGARQRPLPGRVVARRRFLRLAARFCSRSSAATVFSLTRHPLSRRSAVILAAPYLPSCSRSRRATSAFSRSRRAARGAVLPSFHL